MTLSGRFDPWMDAFPRELLPDIFEVVLETWPSYRAAIPRRTIERRLNLTLVRHLQRAARSRRCGFNFEPHSRLLEDDSEVETGELDIKVAVCLAEDVYFAFECKRLFPTSSRSRAEDYTGSGGMGCFLGGQYDGKAGAGGMLGYVITGTAQRARDAVATRIHQDRASLHLKSPFALKSSALHPKYPEIEETRHSRPENNFVLYHVFLSVQEES